MQAEFSGECTLTEIPSLRTPSLLRMLLKLLRISLSPSQDSSSSGTLDSSYNLQERKDFVLRLEPSFASKRLIEVFVSNVKPLLIATERCSGYTQEDLVRVFLACLSSLLMPRHDPSLLKCTQNDQMLLHVGVSR